MSIKFTDLGLSEPVLAALEDVGYEQPSPIQAETIPHILAGVDVLGQAQTGTGKTAAFALPVLSNINKHKGPPQVLVLTPTRELAIQVAEAFGKYAAHIPGFKVLPVYGGQGYREQLQHLRQGVHVVVGTPGRVMDHIRRRTLDLDGLKTIVLDEADEMLRMGFIDDVEWILEQAPEERQIALFSATMPKQVHRIATQHLTDPAEVKIEVKTQTAETIRQRYWMVSGVHKLDALNRILEAEKTDGIIIFVRTKAATEDLAEKLVREGYLAAALNGDIPQQQRERVVERLKKSQLNIIVATDVVARGLDVERVSHVINYDIPGDTESYVHRIGRTGRAGREGDAILFVAPREKRMLFAIERATRQKIEPMDLPSADQVNDVRVERFMERITAALLADDLPFYQGLVEAYEEKHGITPADIAAALAKLVQGDQPFLLQDRKPMNRGASSGGGSGRKVGSAEDGFTRYRIEVGHNHGVKPGNIVGAIANEASLDSKNIGHIEIRDECSYIDLPEGMPKPILQDLKKVWVCGQQLRVRKADAADEMGEGGRDGGGRNDRRGGGGGGRNDRRGGGGGGRDRRPGGGGGRRDGGGPRRDGGGRDDRGPRREGGGRDDRGGPRRDGGGRDDRGPRRDDRGNDRGDRNGNDRGNDRGGRGQDAGGWAPREADDTRRGESRSRAEGGDDDNRGNTDAPKRPKLKTKQRDRDRKDKGKPRRD